MAKHFSGWYITRERNDEARETIHKLRGKFWTDQELDKEIDDAVAFTEFESLNERSTSYLDCFRATDLRRTMIGTLIMSGQHVMGIGFVSV